MNNLRPPASEHPVYHVIGLMSGTSLDGLDVAYCQFTPGDSWRYKIFAAKTYPYTNEWRKKLSSIEKKSAEELACFHSEYGHFLGETAKKFIIENSIKADFVSSHGHTIFHQPERRFTFQLGSGAAIAAECGLPVICDFRTTDVALGGQGAPLVPMGDKLLFSEYDFCLNIGGIANISFDNHRKQRIAYDICPANMALNYLAARSGKEYDKNGEIARAGNVSQKLLNELNSLKFYLAKPPKSLGKEWVLREFVPVMERHRISLPDKMRTIVEHIAVQISSQLRNRRPTHPGSTGKIENRKLFITGGGAHNKFLVKRIESLSPINTFIPEKLTIDFKEALIFAFLGVLRMRNEANCLAAVTGAERDNCGGAVYLP